MGMIRLPPGTGRLSFWALDLSLFAKLRNCKWISLVFFASSAPLRETLLPLARLLPQFHNSGSRAAFLLRGRVEARHVGMLGHHLRHHPFQHAHAVTVHDAHAAGGGHYRSEEHT